MPPVERIPECAQIASLPFRRAYRREVRCVEVVRSTPVGSVKVNLFHHLTLLLHGPGRETAIPYKWTVGSRSNDQ